MINYNEIRERTDTFLQTREGLAQPKIAQDYDVFCSELTGIFCDVLYKNNIPQSEFFDWLDMVQVHQINDIPVGEKIPVAQLISTPIMMHDLYFLLEYRLMVYKPGSTQVGPGEFYMCFYDANSEFGIDPQAGYDIQTGGVRTELKKLNTNFTDAAKFDEYAASNEVDRLMVVKPVSNAAKPKVRSEMVVCDFRTMNWRDVFTHRGAAGTLAFKEVA